MAGGAPVFSESPVSPAPPVILRSPVIPGSHVSPAPPAMPGPLGILDAFPMEILYEILSWSSNRPADTNNSLYALTRVSKIMAVLALPQYIKINQNTLPIIADFHIYMRKDAFYLFPAWTRSGTFPAREELICDFTSPDVARKIDAVDIGLRFLRPALRPKSLTFGGNLDFMQGVDLLDMAGRMRASTVDMDVYHVDFSKSNTIKQCMIHELTQTVELRIVWSSLSSHQWSALLRAISAPQLQELTLNGDVPWTALAAFLSRHPTITKLRLPASHITRLPPKHCVLRLPKLFSLQGHLPKVIAFIKLLSRSPNLSIEGDMPRNSSLIDTVHKIIDSLAACNSNVSLISNLTSTKVNGPLTKARSFPISTLRKWREFPDRLERLIRLRLNVMGIDDSILLVSFQFR